MSPVARRPWRSRGAQVAIVVGCAVGCAVGLVSSRAVAYVPSTTDDGNERLRWKGSDCVKLVPNSAGSDDIADPNVVFAAIRRSIDHWTSAVQRCAYLRLQLLADSPNAVADHKDGGPHTNAIAWVESKWPHDRSAAAITLVHYTASGQIVDTDVELNGQYGHFSAGGEAVRTDIENTLVHEFGHVMGLDHPCDDGSRKQIPKDNLGRQIPPCAPSSRLPRDMLDVTMFNFASLGETKKRTPEADDALGICETYPLSSDPGVCREPQVGGGRGCAVGPTVPLPPVDWMILLALGLWLRRRCA